MKDIILTKGQTAIVDDIDFYFFNSNKWCAVKNKIQTTFYAQRRVRKNNKSVLIFMHTLILKRKLGVTALNGITDHKNGNGLDNRRKNLRVATYSQNCANVGKKKKNATSQYKGVCFEKSCDRWRARIKHNYKMISLGCFDTEIEAAIAYNKAALKIFKEFAFLNKF